jgi:hypothetical protein
VIPRLVPRLAPILAAIAMVALLGGCAPYSGTPSQKVHEWVAQNSFVSDNDTLVNDVIRVREAVKIGTVKQVVTICGGFASDVGTSYTTLPTPDQTLTNELNAADILFVDASTACSGVSSVSSPVMTASLTKLTLGLAALMRAQRRLRSFGVRWNVRL